MGITLQIGDRALPQEELVSLLTSYQLLPALVQGVIIDQATAEIECTPEEVATIRQQFYAQQQITSEAERTHWLQRHYMTLEQFEDLPIRQLKLEKFKQQAFGPRVEAHFLQRKSELDKVIYSLIRTQDPAIAQELFFRIQEGEQSFAEVARQYSQGPEAQTGGLIGPVELSAPHPTLTQMLMRSQPGQLLPPVRLGEWLVIMRLEQRVPVQLDEALRQRLLNELFTNWLQEQLQQTAVTLPSLPISSPPHDSNPTTAHPLSC